MKIPQSIYTAAYRLHCEAVNKIVQNKSVFNFKSLLAGIMNLSSTHNHDMVAFENAESVVVHGWVRKL